MKTILRSMPRRSAVAAFLFALLISMGVRSPENAYATGTLEITSNTGPFVISDSNDPANGPSVVTVEAQVCNTGGTALTDVEVKIGDGTTAGTFPTTTLGGQSYNLILLDEDVNGDVSDGTRFLGSLAASECVTVFWMLKYPTGIDDLDLDFTMWGTADDVGTQRTDSASDTVTVRDEISASSNKLNPGTRTITPAGPYFIGQTMEACYTNADFGIIGNGPNPDKPNDFSFQPVGTSAFNPDIWQLVETSAELVSSKCSGATYSYTNINYFSTVDDGDWDGDSANGSEACSGNSQGVTGEYCYTFVAIGSGTSTLQSYQAASSGANQKYNSDFGNNNITIAADQGCAVGLVKTADKENVLNGDTLTYTVDYTNNVAQTLGTPAANFSITDPIPANTTYQTGTASCPTGGSCTVYFSDDGITFTTAEPATVTHIRFVLDTDIAASATGSASYSVTVNTDAGVTSGAASSAFDGGPTCGSSNTVTTTPVTLARFEATRRTNDVLIEWTTATEVGNVGFNLYAASDSGTRKLNAQIIETNAYDSIVPQDYRFVVVGDVGDTLFIEDVAIDSTRRMHGPFTVGQEYGAAVQTDPVPWEAIRAEGEVFNAERDSFALVETAARIGGVKARDVLGSPAASIDGMGVYGSGGPAAELARIEVAEDGLYRLSFEDLLAAGINLSGFGSPRLTLMSHGVSIPVRIGGGMKFGPGSYIEFYGEAEDGLYTRTNIYTLVDDYSAAQRIGSQFASPPWGVPPTPYYIERLTMGDDGSYSFSAPNGDPWYDTSMFAFASKSWAFDIEVEGMAASPDAPVLSVGTWGVTGFPNGLPDHHMLVEVNGVQVADEHFDGLVDHPVTAALPLGLLTEGSNTLRLTLPADTGYPFDMVNVDTYGVSYARHFIAQGGVLEFESAGTMLKVDGLPTPNIVVYRLDIGGPVQLTGFSVVPNGGSFSVMFAGSPGPARYVVASEPAVPAPAIGALSSPSDISTAGVDYLAISHPNFVSGLDPLLQHHAANGLSTKVVNVEDVYAQFGYGVFGAEAIKAYITSAAADGVQHVLLVGGDTYDYMDNLGSGSISFIPSMYARTGEFVEYAPVDPLYADVDGDNVPDVSLGRFPVRTVAELDTLVAKTLAYAGKDYGMTGVFAADGQDPIADFTTASEDLIAELPAGWTVDRAYVATDGVSAARATLLAKLNEGVALTSFFGHSGPTVWTFQGLFRSSDAPLLTNAGRPTVVTQWGCWNTYYVSPSYNTLGHTFLLSGDRGAAAVLGASTLTESVSEEKLGRLVTPRMVTPGMTIGQAVVDAKQNLALTDPGLIDVQLGWSLLGDPAMVVTQ